MVVDDEHADGGLRLGHVISWRRGATAWLAVGERVRVYQSGMRPRLLRPAGRTRVQIAAMRLVRAEGLADEPVARRRRAPGRRAPSFQLMTTIRTSGSRRADPLDEREAAVDLGQARVDDDDVRRLGARAGPGPGRAGRRSRRPRACGRWRGGRRGSRGHDRPRPRRAPGAGPRSRTQGRASAHGRAAGRARGTDARRGAPSAERRWSAYVIGRGSTPLGISPSRASRHGIAPGPRPTTSMVVPFPISLRQLNVPPIRAARARMPASPRWPSGTWLGSKPLPSSAMRRRTAFGVRRISRRTSWAPACLTTLWSASWAIR